MTKRSSTKTRRHNGKATSAQQTYDDGFQTTLVRKTPSIHRFTRIIGANDIVKGSIDYNAGVSFTLADLPDYAEFQALFDQYRIDWVELAFILKATGPQNPVIYLAEDHDNDSTPSPTEMYERENTQVLAFSADRPLLKYRLRPNILRQVYNGVSTGYERANPGTWQDCSYPGVKHYGIKFFIQNYNSVSNNNCAIALQFRYGVSFKETQ